MLGQMHAAALEQRRRIAIRRGQAGAVEAEQYTDVMNRLRPRVSENWERVKRQFKSLRCRIRARYMSSNEHPTRPLLILEIKPLQQMPTKKPTGNITPWHISIDYYDSDNRQQFVAATRPYADWREVTLVGQIYGAAFYLDRDRCPVGSDRRLEALHATGHYGGYSGLHISL